MVFYPIKSLSMKRKSVYIVILAILNCCFLGCNSNEQKPKGIGKFSDIRLTHPLDKDMVGKGLAIFQAKCFACHKLTDEKLVGPGWKGVTDRRAPEWIMNFINNTQVMLDKDLMA